MFIPRYWSEASCCERIPDRRQITVRRFGWSSTSQADADVHARQRVEEALAVLREGGPRALRGFTRRERKVAYAGSDGFPIREEIVREWDDAGIVVTRNSYGALCLNTTQAMFVDVDRPEPHVGSYGCLGALLGAILGGTGGPLLLGANWIYSAGIGMIVLSVVAAVSRQVRERCDLRARAPVQWAIGRCRAWCESRPDWCVVVYETPAGARLLPVHATFDAGDESVFEFMSFLRADPLYQRMCRLQQCFRARVSPKPWRAGVQQHFRTGGTWPVMDPGKLAVRAEWVRGYEQATRDFASCRLAENIGRGLPDPVVERIRRIHDEMCRADSGLELA